MIYKRLVLKTLAQFLGVALVTAPLFGCNAFQDRAEFAPPQSRWRSTESSPVYADAPPAPVAQQYCYRTLASVDCFSEARPERLTGYTGQYPNPAANDPAVPNTAPPDTKAGKAD